MRHLGFELARAPSGIAERDEAMRRAFALGNRFEDFAVAGHVDAAGDRMGVGIRIIGRMENESRRRFDRPAEKYLQPACGVLAVDA